jgi:hypothetical protein
MDTSLFPTRPGQICKIISVVPDMESDRVCIVADDPAGCNNDDELLVVDLKELQRNVRNPDQAERISVRKDELVVVGEDLESYIKSWNNK